VRGPYPHNFFVLLKDGLELTLARFPGLKIERHIPCPTPNCSHKFNYDNLQRRLQNYGPEIPCEECWETIDIPQLLFGFNWLTREYVIKRLDTLDKGQKQILQEQRELKQLTDREFLSLFKREQRI